jgi:hypothetical protein
VLNPVGWRIEPPFLWDHDGCGYNLLILDFRVLDEPLRDAWLQHVARLVSKRQTMSGLDGLDPLLLDLDASRLTSLQQSLVGALRSGSFMEKAAQSRFDCTKQADCTLCGVKDTTLHWLECPRFSAESSRPGHHSLEGSPTAFTLTICCQVEESITKHSLFFD